MKKKKVVNTNPVAYTLKIMFYHNFWEFLFSVLDEFSVEYCPNVIKLCTAIIYEWL